MGLLILFIIFKNGNCFSLIGQLQLIIGLYLFANLTLTASVCFIVIGVEVGKLMDMYVYMLPRLNLPSMTTLRLYNLIKSD